MTVDQPEPTAGGSQAVGNRPETLVSLLGGGRGALDATLPVVAFVGGWLLTNRSIGWGAVAAVAVAGLIAVWRLRTGARLGAVLSGVLIVTASALVALRTGRAEDFFLVRIFSNAASAVAWTLSIAVRWPLLGVVVGLVLGQKTRWRRDPALLRAYSRASWVWVAQYATRLAVFIPLWAAGQTAALLAAQTALTYPLILACLASSWWVLQKSLPSGHPGLRHPVEVTP